MKKSILIILFTLIYQCSFAQNYKTIDEKVKQYPIYKNLKTLNIRVNNDFTNDEEKARAFYTWIALHINYDLESINKPKPFNVIFYRTLKEYQQKKRAADMRTIWKIMREQKAICGGFSLIFKELCDLSGIESQVIGGITKVNANEINSRKNIKNHAWNAVKINNEWKLLDITWSTGFQDQNTKSWVKDFDDTYFFMKPEQFLTSHFPEHSIWQLTVHKINRTTFFASPIFYPKYFESGFKISPYQNGLIKVLHSNEKSISITFEKIVVTSKIHYKFSKDKYVKSLRLKQNETNEYVATLKYNSKLENILTLYVGLEPILDFKIN